MFWKLKIDEKYIILSCSLKSVENSGSSKDKTRRLQISNAKTNTLYVYQTKYTYKDTR